MIGVRPVLAKAEVVVATKVDHCLAVLFKRHAAMRPGDEPAVA